MTSHDLKLICRPMGRSLPGVDLISNISEIHDSSRKNQGTDRLHFRIICLIVS